MTHKTLVALLTLMVCGCAPPPVVDDNDDDESVPVMKRFDVELLLGGVPQRPGLSFFDTVAVHLKGIGPCDDRRIELLLVRGSSAIPVPDVPQTGADIDVVLTASGAVSLAGAPSFAVEGRLSCAGVLVDRAVFYPFARPMLDQSRPLVTTHPDLHQVLVLDDGGALTLSSADDGPLTIDAFSRAGERRGSSQACAISSLEGSEVDIALRRLDNGLTFFQLTNFSSHPFEQNLPHDACSMIINDDGSVRHSWPNRAVRQVEGIGDKLVLVHVTRDNRAVVDIIDAVTGDDLHKDIDGGEALQEAVRGLVVELHDDGVDLVITKQFKHTLLQMRASNAPTLLPLPDDLGLLAASGVNDGRFFAVDFVSDSLVVVQRTAAGDGLLVEAVADVDTTAARVEVSPSGRMLAVETGAATLLYVDGEFACQRPDDNDDARLVTDEGLVLFSSGRVADCADAWSVAYDRFEEVPVSTPSGLVQVVLAGDDSEHLALLHWLDLRLVPLAP